ncbi:MAG: 16S rRNA (adenine(1518)-N(6)/adenine(1519)-N(6))-dimethyltransferase RsmA [Candidatus Poseidoniaceae archaeon]|jgi:16S rRNA (adenine1518-N6/adenine1519-N6)-dimethyltransferase|nr:16S rRNA (adenine(1518)-N(6)/adenine(1519)-N(6))-dimethyltransferase RsmA [Candidatus Poseidoniaceae archaeon]
MRGAKALIDRLRSTQSADKSLGQHYLHDEDVLDEILKLAELNSEDIVLEIGPGPGVLTERILNSEAKLTAIELDSGTCEFLSNIFDDLDLIKGDALRVNWPKANKFVANIPYQISSPLIDIITRETSIKTVVILVQEEFAERLVVDCIADRGSLGMSTKLDWKASMERRVGPHCFAPSPKVNSRLVKLTRITPPPNSKLTKMLIRQSFEQRRKKLRNTLSRAPKRINRVTGWHSKLYGEAIKQVNPNILDLRPEDLEIEDWLQITTELERARQSMG